MGHWRFLLGGAKSEYGDWKEKEERGAGFGFHVFLGWYGIGRRNITWKREEKRFNTEGTEAGAQSSQRRDPGRSLVAVVPPLRGPTRH
jgi:hypothetical protein